MQRYFYRAIVRSIYDGDTIRADIDLGFNTWLMNEQLRLANIDTPEIRGEERPYGLVSKSFVEDQIPPGTEIYVMTEKDQTGKYGRYLATIFYGETMTNLNEELVLNGLAEQY